MTLRLPEANYGDVPTWISAVTGLLAFLAAVAAAVVAYRLYGIESARDRHADEERQERAQEARRAQANKVTAWFGPDVPTEEERARVLMHPRVWPRAWAACVANASDLPVYDVVVTFCFVNWQGRTWSAIERGTGAQPIVTLPPRSETFVAMPEEVRGDVTEINESTFVIIVEFRDTAGTRWRRDDKGRLSEITP